MHRGDLGFGRLAALVPAAKFSRRRRRAAPLPGVAGATPDLSDALERVARGTDRQMLAAGAAVIDAGAVAIDAAGTPALAGVDARSGARPARSAVEPDEPVIELRGAAAGVRPVHCIHTAFAKGRWTVYLAVLDAAMATLAATAPLLVRGGHSPLAGRLPDSVLPLLLPPLWLLTLALGGAYDRRILVIGADEYRRVGNAAIWLLAAVSFASYATDTGVSRGVVAAVVPMLAALTLVERYAARKLLHQQIIAGSTLHNVVVVGAPGEVRNLIQHMRRAPHAGFNVVGACVAGAERVVDVPGGAVPVVGPIDDVARAVRRVGADTIAVAGTEALPPGRLRRLAWELEGSGVTLVVAPSLTDIAGPRIRIRPVYGLPLLHIEEPEFRGFRRLIKEMVDRVGVVALSLILSPLLVAIALAVRLSSPGPVLFRQVRVGRYGRPFSIWKFRSMYAGAESQRQRLAHLSSVDGPLFKIRRDPRLTSVGRWLRRFSLDELPQLWNVLTGSMSLVGPRPPLPEEVATYPDDVRRRLLVKPGLTGLWQVSGRADLSWEEAVRLDLFYVENWSVAMDAMVIWKTLGAVLHGRGAY